MVTSQEQAAPTLAEQLALTLADRVVVALIVCVGLSLATFLWNAGKDAAAGMVFTGVPGLLAQYHASVNAAAARVAALQVPPLPVPAPSAPGGPK
jgi:hypothetical protein